MQTVKQSAMALFLTVIPFAVVAHPHSFISLKTELVTDGTQLSGLKMRWTMDEITSADLLYDAGNAKPGDEIWKKLAAEVMAQRAWSALFHRVLAQRTKSEIYESADGIWHDPRRTSGGTDVCPAAGASAAAGWADLYVFHL